MSMSQAVQHIIDANAPMVFTYAHSRPEVRRIVYPTGINGNTVNTIDAETGKFKKFKLDGIIFPKPDVQQWVSYAIDQGLTVSFNYLNSNPEFKRVGVPVKLSKNGNSVLVRLETYLPYRRYSNQDPSYVEHKYFKISGIENFQPVSENLPEKNTSEFPDWIMNTDWSHGLDDEEPLEVELIDLSPYDDEDDECETTDEEYLPDEEHCIGCRHNIANQKAHYGGCLDDDDEDY